MAFLYIGRRSDSTGVLIDSPYKIKYDVGYLLYVHYCVTLMIQNYIY